MRVFGLCLFLFMGCASANQAAPKSNTSASSTSEDLRITKESLTVMIDEILPSLESVRGLSIGENIHTSVLDLQELSQYTRNVLADFLTEEELLLQIKVMKMLGFFPLDFGGVEAFFDLYTSQILGVYDPKENVLMVNGTSSFSELKMITAHELVHGLQDIHFDLEKYTKITKSDSKTFYSDIDRARIFMIEGDAQGTVYTFLSAEKQPAKVNRSQLAQRNDYLLSLKTEEEKMANFIRYMAMPYHHAAQTIILYASDKGWSGVNELYKNLPTSTEQMMHVEKLIAREAFFSYYTSPEWIEVILPNFTHIFSDELGESGFLSLLADVATSPAQAMKYADGWNGDRFLVFQDNNILREPALLIGRTDWDSAQDAQEFANGWKKYLQKHVGSKWPYFVSINDTAVIYGIGTSSEKIQKATWASFQQTAK